MLTSTVWASMRPVVDPFLVLSLTLSFSFSFSMIFFFSPYIFLFFVLLTGPLVYGAAWCPIVDHRTALKKIGVAGIDSLSLSFSVRVFFFPRFCILKMIYFVLFVLDSKKLTEDQRNMLFAKLKVSHRLFLFLFPPWLLLSFHCLFFLSLCCFYC